MPSAMPFLAYNPKTLDSHALKRAVIRMLDETETELARGDWIILEPVNTAAIPKQ